MNFADKLYYYGPQIAKACDQLEAKALRDSGDIYIIDLTMGTPKWDLTEQGRKMFKTENNETEQHDSALLNERGNNYGRFDEHARITQSIKRCMYRSKNWALMSDDKRESLEMMAHKIGRILNGNPDYIDSWKDLVGYTQLVVDKLQKTEGATDAKVIKQIVKDGVLVDA